MAADPVAAAPVASVPALYVGDLHAMVVDRDLYDLFAAVGAVASVRVCKDAATRRSLGYGYVNYIALQDAKDAIEKLNHTLLYGRPIRIMWSVRDPDARKSGIGNLFVKNLSSSIDNARLHEMFVDFGTILSCKVARDEVGKSKGYGFVQFDSQESANSAIEKLNNSSVDGKQIYVANFVKRSDRLPADHEIRYTNLYMKNLDQDITEELIKLKFSEFGKILSVKIAKDDNGTSKGFGFVSFESADSAKKAVEKMNGVQLGSKTLYVARAQKKAERQEILRSLYEEKRNEIVMKTASNVYVKYIDDAVDDNDLRKLFSQCGTITSAKIMRDDKGISKGFGFVCFSTPEEARKAVETLHGHMFYGKPLYIAMAERKHERQTKLQIHYAAMAGLASSSNPMLHAGYPSLYYAPTGLVSQDPGRQAFMYQSFGLRPAWRPSTYVPPSRPAFQPMHFHFTPNAPRYHRQNRGRMNGMYSQQANNSLGFAKDSSSQQRYVQTKYIPNERQRDMNNGLVVSPNASDLQGTEMLSSMLAAAAPQQQKQILGEHLFPLVEKRKPDLAAKITGMLLEMDNSELLVLLESPDSLAAKVEEAVKVLQLSKAKIGSQESLQPNYLSSEVAVN
ncbi:polyadenylate-binding protein 4-like [Ananas comosus]|uniref:Polyadenylate-binding protein n=1 Tax=Ananas comosus TaxID=4615 RepID=A0A6P5F8Q5_ANACO|nr:polyadenylate-binding protein 4-like [Ananas comosus]